MPSKGIFCVCAAYREAGIVCQSAVDQIGAMKSVCHGAVTEKMSQLIGFLREGSSSLILRV